jgi:hypothetical protein
LAFFWKNFSRNNEEDPSTYIQFPFWRYIPNEFSNIESILKGEYEFPNIAQTILHEMWDKYITDPKYDWQHLAIRAEAAGVNLNARSRGVTNINVNGLLALTEQLTKSAINEISQYITPNDDKKVTGLTHQAILKTLIHEWGTKSYEFRLHKNNKNLFRAHCYFGSKPDNETQDCFPHLKIYSKYGGPLDSLKFLMNEIE